LNNWVTKKITIRRNYKYPNNLGESRFGLVGHNYPFLLPQNYQQRKDSIRLVSQTDSIRVYEINKTTDESVKYYQVWVNYPKHELLEIRELVIGKSIPSLATRLVHIDHRNADSLTNNENYIERKYTKTATGEKVEWVGKGRFKDYKVEEVYE
jgi:hypothetical protein